MSDKREPTKNSYCVEPFFIRLIYFKNVKKVFKFSKKQYIFHVVVYFCVLTVKKKKILGKMKKRQTVLVKLKETQKDFKETLKRTTSWLMLSRSE